jgi:hypothetical protein
MLGFGTPQALSLAALGSAVYCEVDLVHADGVRNLPKWL